MSSSLTIRYHGMTTGQRDHFEVRKLLDLAQIGMASYEVGAAGAKVG